MKIAKKKRKRDDAVELDHEIAELFGNFVPLGIALMKMRDTRLYLEFGFDTFDDYVRDRRGIVARQARHLIRASLIASAIGGTNCSPRINGDPIVMSAESQARMLTDTDVVVFEYRDETDSAGRNCKVPIAVKNPEYVSEVWSGVAKKYAEAYERAEVKKPKLSANFIAGALPPKHRARLPAIYRMAKGKKLGKVGMVALRAVKLADEIRDKNLWDIDKLREIAESEEWTKGKLSSMRRDIKSADDAIGRLRDCLSRIRC